MTLEQLIFIGLNSRVTALDRDTGEIYWKWKSHKGSGYVSVMLDGDRLIVSVSGYTYCLNPLTGEEIWFNPLKGFGFGIPAIASVNGSSSASWLAAAEQRTAAEHANTTPAT